jgi:hypothetical protein
MRRLNFLEHDPWDVMEDVRAKSLERRMLVVTLEVSGERVGERDGAAGAAGLRRAELAAAVAPPNADNVLRPIDVPCSTHSDAQRPRPTTPHAFPLRSLPITQYRDPSAASSPSHAGRTSVKAESAATITRRTDSPLHPRGQPADRNALRSFTNPPTDYKFEADTVLTAPRRHGRIVLAFGQAARFGSAMAFSPPLAYPVGRCLSAYEANRE